ncbi:MAG TPA: 4-hydroxy-tetrahydrodipicolinate reductase [Stellaceae bacterium]|nr:4-hydroxy-tetrahydrodipicolinate reductase [Stellaceae bacterium]
MTKIGIVGCAGRMGRMLVAELVATEGASLAGGIDHAADIAGKDLGLLAGIDELGIVAGSDPAALSAEAEVLIDFTVPAATSRLAGIAAKASRPLVTGTTGLGAAEQEAVNHAAIHIPIVQAANFSAGVNLLLGLVEQAAARLGPDFDIEILEVHHRLKIDAPSGTALALGEAAARGRGIRLGESRARPRDGETGRVSGTIGFASLRGGDVVGDHTVVFAGPGERLELTHKAADRRIFARGAVRAALWVVGRRPGLYGMKDVLGL